jgi:predicted transcriptional regulator
MKNELDANIVEPILEACTNEATIIRLANMTKGVASYNNLKEYLFYLVDYDMISYQGDKRVYTMRYEGWRLLSMIKRTKKETNADNDNADIMIDFTQADPKFEGFTSPI